MIIHISAASYDISKEHWIVVKLWDMSKPILKSHFWGTFPGATADKNFCITLSTQKTEITAVILTENLI